MALELVTVKARTRGKTPVEFSYQGVGKLTERTVMSGKEEPAKNEDGTPKLDEKGQPVMVQAPARDAQGNPITVHDVDVNGITTDVQDVINLFASHPVEGKTPAQRLIDGALLGFNIEQRKAASPVVEVDKEDELTPLITELIAKSILSQDDVAVWRRNITSGAKMVEVSRLEYAEMTKEVKKLRKAA